MSRIQKGIGNAIIVKLSDVAPGDVLYVQSNENDSILDKIEVNGAGNYRFHYRPRRGSLKMSLWMDEDRGGYVVIHDLKKEREELIA